MLPPKKSAMHEYLYHTHTHTYTHYDVNIPNMHAISARRNKDANIVFCFKVANHAGIAIPNKPNRDSPRKIIAKPAICNIPTNLAIAVADADGGYGDP